jgi:hypothetical protein
MGEVEHGEELGALASMTQTLVLESLALISSETTMSLADFGCRGRRQQGGRRWGV